MQRTWHWADTTDVRTHALEILRRSRRAALRFGGPQEGAGVMRGSKNRGTDPAVEAGRQIQTVRRGYVVAGVMASPVGPSYSSMRVPGHGRGNEEVSH